MEEMDKTQKTQMRWHEYVRIIAMAIFLISY